MEHKSLTFNVLFQKFASRHELIRSFFLNQENLKTRKFCFIYHKRFTYLNSATPNRTRSPCFRNGTQSSLAMMQKIRSKGNNEITCNFYRL